MITNNNNVSVNLTPELRVEQALKEAGVEDLTVITKLNISGPITDDDFEYLRKNLGETLQELDMGNASIEEAGMSFGVFDEFAELSSIVFPKSFVGIPWGVYQICPDLTSVTISGQSLLCLMNEVLYSDDDDDDDFDDDEEDDDEDFDDDGDDEDFDDDEDDEDFEDEDYDEDFEDEDEDF